MRRETVLGKILTRGCVSRIRFWREEASGVLIGAGGTRRSEWPTPLKRRLCERVIQYVNIFHVILCGLFSVICVGYFM